MKRLTISEHTYKAEVGGSCRLTLTVNRETNDKEPKILRNKIMAFTTKLRFIQFFVANFANKNTNHEYNFVSETQTCLLSF